MPTIEQTAIYQRIAEKHRDALASDQDHIAYDYPEFQLEVMAGGLVKTVATAKAKWLSAIADGVIIPRGSKSYTLGVLDLDRFREVLTLSGLKKIYTYTYTYTQEKAEPCIHPGDEFRIIGGDGE